MTTKPRVAIIIPCLNAASTIDACLDSALKQSYEHTFIHVQDGGSTDGTLDKLAQRANPRLRVAVAKDTSVYDAINTAIANTDADWYYILGADDKIPGLDSVASVMTFGHSKYTLLFGDVRYAKRTNQLVPHVHHSTFDNGLWWRNTLHQQGVFYHRSLFEGQAFDLRYKILSDYDFHLSLLKKMPLSKHVGMTLCVCGAAGLSKQFEWKLYKEELKIKRHRLSAPLFIANIPWVCMKWLLKKFG